MPNVWMPCNACHVKRRQWKGLCHTCGREAGLMRPRSKGHDLTGTQIDACFLAAKARLRWERLHGQGAANC